MVKKTSVPFPPSICRVAYRRQIIEEKGRKREKGQNKNGEKTNTRGKQERKTEKTEAKKKTVEEKKE